MVSLTKAQRFFVVACLCIFAGLRLSNTDEGDIITASSGSNIITLLVQAIVIGCLALFWYVKRRTLTRHLRHLFAPMTLVLLAVASSIWSLDPGFTFRRSIIFVAATLCAYYFGVVYDPAALAKLYRRAIGIMVGLSILVIGLLPSYGISHGTHAGDWRGAFFHKNRLGEMMALAVITFAIAPPERLSGWYRWSFAAFSLILLYKSHDSTALVAVVAALAAQAVWLLFKLKRKALTGVALIGYPLIAVVIGLILSDSNTFFKLLGKDATFSGRDRLWAGVIDAIQQRPLLGYGYLAFWNQQDGSMILVNERTTFRTSHSHDGFLNMALHVGLIGLGIFIIFLLRCMVLSIQEGRRTKSPEARWYFSFIIFMVISNLTESQIIEPFFFMWVTLVAFYVTFSVDRSHRHVELEIVEERAEKPQLYPAVS